MAEQARRALITGISGQDGSFLAELLLAKGYEVTGLSRGGRERSLGCSEHLRARVNLAWCDLLDADGLRAVLAQTSPHELYHLGSPSFVPASWREPRSTLEAIAGATAAVLEAVRDTDPRIRTFLASSIAMFGDAPESPQREDTPCRPTNPYAIAKLAAHQLLGAMREREGLYLCSGILANHESERRPERFVTRKITRAAAAIKLGLQSELELGNLDAVRDWSFAGDIMAGAWLMLQQQRPRRLRAGQRCRADGARVRARWPSPAWDLQAERYIRVDPALVRPLRAHPSPSAIPAARALGARLESIAQLRAARRAHGARPICAPCRRPEDAAGSKRGDAQGVLL